MNTTQHPLSGQTVKVSLKAQHPQLDGLDHEFTVEDWWDHLTGTSWMHSNGNPAALIYALRTGMDPAQTIPTDDQVIYGKIGPFGHLIHESEIA
jgi:hypothetical protein